MKLLEALNFKNLLFCLIGLTICFSSCEFNVSTASLGEVKMCKQMQNEQLLCDEDQVVFNPSDEKFHVSTKLSYAPEDTKVTFNWYGYDQGTKVLIDSVTLRAGDYGSGSSYDLNSSLTLGGQPWPKGEYEVKIAMNTDNSTPIVKKFMVQ